MSRRLAHTNSTKQKHSWYCAGCCSHWKKAAMVVMFISSKDDEEQPLLMLPAVPACLRRA